MFSPERMEKLSILVLDRDRDKVVERLKERGNAHVIRTSLKGGGEGLDGIRRGISRVDKLLEILGRFEGKPGLKGLLGEEEVVKGADPDTLKIEKRVTELDKRFRELEERERRIKEDIAVMEKVERLGVPVVDTQNLGVVFGEFGRGKFAEVEGELPKGSYVAGKVAEKKRILAAIAYMKSEQETLFAILNRRGFSELKIREGVKSRKLRDELVRIERVSEKTEAELEKFSGKFKGKLEALKRQLVADKEEMEIVEGFEGSRHTYLIESWIPSKDVRETAEFVSKDVKCHTRLEKPSEKDEVPVLLKNPGFIKPFEFLTKLYGTPNYREIDPTPILAFTFPLLFGAMFGDIGHGLILSAFAVLMRYFSKNRGAKNMLDFSDIILACGLASVVFGFLYGSVFGYEDVLSAIFIKPSHSAIEMMGIAMFVGVLHLAVGMGINSFNRSGFLGRVSALLKLWFFFGEAIIMTKLFGLPIPVLEWFVGIPFLTAAVAGVGVPAVLLVLLEMAEGGFRRAGQTLGDALFEIFELFTKFLSNIISYSRIFALALVHAMLFAAIFLIAEMVQPYGIFVLVFGTLAAVGLEVLIVFIHSLRLHFYEWFDKFYMNGGKEFRPFGSIEGGD